MNKKIEFAFILTWYGISVVGMFYGMFYYKSPMIIFLCVLITVVTVICSEIIHIRRFFDQISSGAGLSIKTMNIIQKENNESLH